MGCWTPVETFGLEGDPVAVARAGGGGGFDWAARLLQADGSAFEVLQAGVPVATVQWPLLGRHNVMNALAALAAAHAVGVDPARVAPALAGFRSVKRRDRKSTRLNSSHVKISYAVFCLKKKNNR